MDLTLETSINYFAFLLREAQEAVKQPTLDARRQYAVDCVSNFKLTASIADQVDSITLHRKGSLAGRIASDVLFIGLVLERRSLASP